MRQSELLSYTYDFISQLVDNDKFIPAVRRLILFGRVARGDFTKKSDVDLFIDIKSLEYEKDIEETVKKELNKFETRAEKTWFLRKIILPIKTIVGDIEQEKWKDLREEILNYGKTLYDDFEYLPEKIEHKALILYSISSLSQKEKMSLLRTLYGYSIKKGKKTYTQKGIISEIKGEKISANSIIVDIRDLAKVKKLLKGYGIKYNFRDIWIK